MPDVRKQIAISDGCGQTPGPAATANVFGDVDIPRPLGLRPDDRGRAVSGPTRLGPSRRPARPVRRHRAWTPTRIARSPGATVAASWAFERGIGLQAPAGAHEFVTETGADGRYIVPKLDDLPSGASTRVRRFTLIVYHRGHVAGAAIACSRARGAPRLQPARQPRAPGEAGRRYAPRRARRCSWAAAPGSARSPPGSCRRPRSSWKAAAPAARGRKASAPGAGRRPRRRCRSTSRSCCPTTRSAG